MVQSALGEAAAALPSIPRGQDLEELRSYWGGVLGIDGSSIQMQRKSNSGQLQGRIWRSRYGVLTVVVSDTYFRSRLQAWIDRIKDDWALDFGV